MAGRLRHSVARRPALSRSARALQRLGARLRGRPVPIHDPTVAGRWELYARQYLSGNQGHRLGDEWNKPQLIGIDASPEKVVATLDERVFAPFLGHCAVLLEIGPGGGRFTELLLGKCDRLIAADTSSTMLKVLRDRFSGEAALECLLLDGTGLTSVPDGAVDAVFSYDVFIHLQHWDIYNYLCEIHRVLRPEGKAVVHHANTFSELGWKAFEGDVKYQLNRHKLGGTFTVMTPELMAGFAERAGLRYERAVTDVVRRDCISLLRQG
jgi:SAM-dependent methyltransferase